MPRKLNVYQTSQGFYDLVVAAPSMKAALEMWGAGSNLFQQGYAHLATDPKAAAAAMKRPGVVLRRAVGSSGTFAEQAVLSSIETLDSNMAKSPAAPAKVEPAPALEKTSAPRRDLKALQKAVAAFEHERLRKERERAGETRAEAKAAKARQVVMRWGRGQSSSSGQGLQGVRWSLTCGTSALVASYATMFTHTTLRNYLICNAAIATGLMTSSALAAETFYIAQDSQSHTCTVVAAKPDGRVLIDIGGGALETQEVALQKLSSLPNCVGSALSYEPSKNGLEDYTP